MAAVTVIGRTYVRAGLATRSGTVMTSGAAASDQTMIHFGWSPAVNCVATVTGAAGLDMACAFASGFNTVVAS